MKLVFRHTLDAFWPWAGWTWRLPGCEGAEEEAHGCAGVGLEIATVLQALGDQDRMREAHDRAHDDVGGLARIHRLELAGLDAVAQDEFSHGAHGFLVRVNGLPAVLDGGQDQAVDALVGAEGW